MRSARGFVSYVAASALVACGGFLGFGDDDDSEETPPAGPGSEAGAETATGTGDFDGTGPSVDASAADGDLGDVVIVVPPIDATVDAPPAGQLFPRLATFESATLTLPNGADVNDGMDLLSTGPIKGTYSAHTKDASTFIGFTFASKPPQELFVAFAIRFDAMPPMQMPAAFFRLAVPNGENIVAAVQSDGDVYVSGGSPKTIGAAQVGVVYLFGVHARVSPTVLEAVIVAAPDFDGVTPTDVGWSGPASLGGAIIGELSGTSMRITVDQIGLNETGFDVK